MFMIVDIFAQDFFSNSKLNDTPDLTLREFRSFANFRRNLNNQVKPTTKTTDSAENVFRFAKYRQN